MVFTDSPVPVGTHSRVTTLVDERVFKELKVVSVPWEEIPSEVNLSFGLGRVKARKRLNKPSG